MFSRRSDWDLSPNRLAQELEALKRAGIAAGTVRLSIGLEDADDLVDDLSRALKEAQRTIK